MRKDRTPEDAGGTDKQTQGGGGERGKEGWKGGVVAQGDGGELWAHCCPVADGGTVGLAEQAQVLIHKAVLSWPSP